MDATDLGPVQPDLSGAIRPKGPVAGDTGLLRRAITCRWFAVALILLAGLGAGWFLPGPVTGCYTISSVSTSGHCFLYFHAGSVFWMCEGSVTARWLGTYSREPGIGVVFSRADTGRRILLRPRLVRMSFQSLDTGDAGWEWRYPHVLTARKVISGAWGDGSAERDR